MNYAFVSTLGFILLHSCLLHHERQHGWPATPSRRISGMSAKAATGSAHGLCQIALTAKPERAIQAIYPQREDSAASAFRAALEVTTAKRRFRLPSQGITTAAANRTPPPIRLRCASRYPEG